MANFSFPLFKNDYKNRDTQPDYRAQITIEDEHLEVLREIIAKVDAGDSVAVDCAAWMRKSKGGKYYYSCMFSVTPEKVPKRIRSPMDMEIHPIQRAIRTPDHLKRRRSEILDNKYGLNHVASNWNRGNNIEAMAEYYGVSVEEMKDIIIRKKGTIKRKESTQSKTWRATISHRFDANLKCHFCGTTSKKFQETWEECRSGYIQGSENKQWEDLL